MQKNINFDYNDIVPYFEEELNKKQIKNAVRYIAEEYDMGKISEVSFEFFVTTLLISFMEKIFEEKFIPKILSLNNKGFKKYFPHEEISNEPRN